MKALLPPDETQRLAALRSYNVLNSSAEEAFDDIARLAAHICQTPIALVSLVDETCQWFKSKVGVNFAETPRDIAFCAHAILRKDEILEVRDALADPRFSDNPMVTGDQRIRFYAGAPLVAPGGEALGTLCVMDQTSRTLTAEQHSALRALSRQIVSQLELRRQARQMEQDAAERVRAEARINEQIRQLSESKQESDKFLARAEKMRLSLLSVIEDEKRAGKKLRESEGRFRQLAENINEVFWITDPAMHEIIYTSPAYEKIWGRTCASLYASPLQWLETIHPEDSERVAQASANAARSGSFEATYRIIRPDKTERWIHDRGFPVRDAAGEIYRIVGTAEDITERRSLEEQYRQSQKMESLGQLAGGIAHDFNNILSAVVMSVDLAKLEAANHAAILGLLENISNASLRAIELVRQILTFSHQDKPEREPVKLSHVVIEATKLLRSSLPVTVRIQTELADVPTVMANATSIHQVIMNLGTNAWHAMRRQSGIIKIEIKAREMDDELAKKCPDLRPGKYVQLSVSDTGCGMDRATLERIFEPFFTTKEIGEGTGLGLAVVHGIMKSHEGGIFVQSQPGEGTTFNLYFPAAEAEVVDQTQTEKPIPLGNGQHILYVDDEEVLADLGKQLLEMLGYFVTTNTSSLEAIKAVRDQPGKFDLVITDLTMPGMDGAELAAQLRQLYPHLPIILMTGNKSLLKAESADALACQELLNKPCDAQTLGETVDRVLRASAPGPALATEPATRP